MTSLAPTMQSFFTMRLAAQQNASPNTVAAYRDTFRLLLRFVNDTTGVTPNKLTIEELDADTIGRFLDHLESGRGTSIKTRNSRLAAILKRPGIRGGSISWKRGLSHGFTRQADYASVHG